MSKIHHLTTLFASAFLLLLPFSLHAKSDVKSLDAIESNDLKTLIKIRGANNADYDKPNHFSCWLMKRHLTSKLRGTQLQGKSFEELLDFFSNPSSTDIISLVDVVIARDVEQKCSPTADYYSDEQFVSLIRNELSGMAEQGDNEAQEVLTSFYFELAEGYRAEGEHENAYQYYGIYIRALEKQHLTGEHSKHAELFRAYMNLADYPAYFQPGSAVYYLTKMDEKQRNSIIISAAVCRFFPEKINDSDKCDLDKKRFNPYLAVIANHKN